VSSGDFVTIEVLRTRNDDAERMVKGDPGAESVFYWDRRPLRAWTGAARHQQPTLFGSRGGAEGLGVQFARGPVAVRARCTADILEVRIVESSRAVANSHYKGKSFGSNAARGGGFH